LFLETPYASQVELEAKRHFKDKMISLNNTTKKSEWCTEDLKTIIEYIKSVDNSFKGIIPEEKSQCIIL
jgi:hypothetical protein